MSHKNSFLLNPWFSKQSEIMNYNSQAHQLRYFADLIQGWIDIACSMFLWKKYSFHCNWIFLFFIACLSSSLRTFLRVPWNFLQWITEAVIPATFRYAYTELTVGWKLLQVLNWFRSDQTSFILDVITVSSKRQFRCFSLNPASNPAPHSQSHEPSLAGSGAELEL